MNYKWYRARYSPLIVEDLNILPCKDDEIWVSINKASEILGVCENTIRNWCFRLYYYKYKTPIKSFKNSKFKVTQAPVYDSVRLRKPTQKRGKIFVKIKKQ